MSYSIVDGIALNKKVLINENWKKFLTDNYVIISGWIEMKKVRYLQGINLDVHEIIYKLDYEKDKQRK